MESNKTSKQVIFEKEGALVQFALKNCLCKTETISDKCNLSIEQMAQICKGHHPYLKDYVSVLSCCLNETPPKKGKLLHILAVLYNIGVDIDKDEINRLLLGDSSNPLEYDKLLRPICAAAQNKKKQSRKKTYRGFPGLISDSIDPYYNQPYVQNNDKKNNSSDFEYGLTDT